MLKLLLGVFVLFLQGLCSGVDVTPTNASGGAIQVNAAARMRRAAALRSECLLSCRIGRLKVAAVIAVGAFRY